ncbi:tyrosine-type recombinase/integrase [Terasakiella pusilla]|uniref:tyrosine-type recombinase/integrase n=1 Tax=Terasakiella pusilla TaxID=64973 RepID=UPI003AA8B6E7
MNIEKRVSKLTEKISWRVNYKDMKGVRRAKTFKTQKEAKKWATKAAYDLSMGMHTPESVSITIEQAGNLWVQRAERDKRELSTIRQYNSHLTHHINPRLGNIKLSNLTTPMVEDFADSLQDACSIAMVQKVLTSLRSLINESIRRGFVSNNVASAVRRKSHSRHKKAERIPTKHELAALIQTAESRWKPLIITAAFTGLRSSELRGLTWENVNFKTSEITVNQRADENGHMNSPKSRAGTRQVPMAPLVVRSLKEWKLECTIGPMNLVFPNWTGRVESHANILNRGFYPLMKQCGFIDTEGKRLFKFHALRHAAASLFIDDGWNIKKIQTVMGHSSSQITLDTYGHLFPDEHNTQEAMARIEQGVFLA